VPKISRKFCKTYGIVDFESLIDVCAYKIVETTPDTWNQAGRCQSGAVLDAKNSINVAALLGIGQGAPKQGLTT